MKKIYSFFLLLGLLLSVGNAWGAYEMATSIAVGDQVVLVCEHSNPDLSKELGSIGTNGTLKFGLGDDYTTTPAGTILFDVVAGKSANTFAFKHGDTYLNWTSGNSLNLDGVSISNNTSWGVSITNDGTATILNDADAARQIWWNANSPRFACYTGKTAGNVYYNVQLYKYTSSGSQSNCDLALTDAPIALTFDLYNNSDPQVINYTTSSTGAVSIASSAYATFVINQANKTITVTPTAVTPSAQTITVSQAADENYKAGNVSFTISIANSTPPTVYSTIEDLFAAATTTEQTVQVAFNNWVVSGVSTNGKNVFVTDGTNGFVIYSSSDVSATYPVNSILSGTISCTLKKYNGFAELLSVSGLTITAGGVVAEASVAMADLAGVNTGALLHYEGLTCSVDNNKYYLSDGTTTIQVYNSLFAFDALEDGKTYNITGVYQQYNSTKEILPRSANDIEEVVILTPSIEVSTNSIEATAEETAGTINVTYNNITDVVAEVYFCNAAGTAEATYDWVTADINAQNNVEYIIEANIGAARTAYMKVYALDDQTQDVYSELITISQAEYVAPVEGIEFIYKKVTAGTVTDGQYLIVYEGDATHDAVAFNGSLTTLDAANNGIVVDIINEEIAETSELNAAEFTIDATAGSLKSASGFYIGVNSYSNGLKQNATTPYEHTFSVEDGNALVGIGFESGTMYLNYNYNQNDRRFRYYKNGSQKAIALYKKCYELTLGTNGYSTFAADFKYTVSGATAYKAKYQNGAIVLTPVEVVAAGQGIILKGTEGATATITPSNAEADDFSDNELVGVLTATTAEANYYALATIDQDGITKFHPCAGIEIPANKACMIIENANNAPIRIIETATNIMNVDDVENSVKFVENGQLFIKKNGVIYNAVGAVVK